MDIRYIVCTNKFAGVESYVASVSAELLRRGHDVEVIGGETDRMRAILGPLGGSHVIAHTIQDLVRANLKRPQPDLVHTHMTGSDIAGVLTRPLVRRPLVSTLHFAQPRGHSALTRTLTRPLRTFITTEVAVSQFVADAVRGNTVVILNGLPDVATESVDLPDRKPIVLMAQRLQPEKDTDTALRAWAASKLPDQGWELHIVGDGGERTALEKTIASLGIADSVFMPGTVTDVARRMTEASIYLATAGVDSFGLSVVEAMSHSLPVVSTDAGGHRETIAPVSASTLFPVGDHKAAAAILDRLGADPTARLELGDSGRQRYLHEFTVERHADRLEALYRRLVN